MTGRWPANVILSHEMAEVLDGQSGNVKSGGSGASKKTAPSGNGHTHGAMKHLGYTNHPPSEGGASRFFLNAGYEPWELEWILANGLVPCGVTVYHGH